MHTKHLNIKQLLLAYGGVVGILVLILLVGTIVLFQQLNASQKQEYKLVSSMEAAAAALVDLDAAITLLHDIALTGNLDNAEQANELLNQLPAKLTDSFQEAPQQADALKKQIVALHELGIKTAKIYLLQGKEAGNRMLYQPVTGFDAVASSIQNRLTEHLKQLRKSHANSAEKLAQAGQTARRDLLILSAILLILVPLAIMHLYTKLNKSIGHILATVEQITAGNNQARCRLRSGDELQALADAFDHMQDERTEQLTRLEEQNHRLAEKDSALLQMTSPITQIWPQVLFLPVVGIVDERRGQDIMQVALETIADSRAKAFIMDISGVATMDAAVAGHLIKITRATRVMGCESTISGLSPEIAQTIVQMGIEIGNVKTTATMQDAIADVFRDLGLKFGKEI